MLLVFMNSSSNVWEALSTSVHQAGFITEGMNIFDKQHGTFKQFVSENTAGCDLVLHCRKPQHDTPKTFEYKEGMNTGESIRRFLENRQGDIPRMVYLHVLRESELDVRMLYSEWIAFGLLRGHKLADFATFRVIASEILKTQEGKENG
jgi:hypothetical protein